MNFYFCCLFLNIYDGRKFRDRGQSTCGEIFKPISIFLCSKREFAYVIVIVGFVLYCVYSNYDRVLSVFALGVPQGHTAGPMLLHRHAEYFTVIALTIR